MKIIMLIICMACLVINTNAQHKIFLRVYNNDQMFARGFYIGAKDSSILLTQRKDTIEINYRQIGLIKTRRGTGHDILISAAITASAGAIIGAATYQKPEPADPLSNFFNGLTDLGAGGNAVAGFFLGGIAGTLIGGINGAVKHKETLLVNGMYENWNQAKLRLQQLAATSPATTSGN
jgi:hypothetical protein